MDEKANLDEDLPLSSNFKQFTVDHYFLSLKCDVKRKMFSNCKLVLAVRKGPDWRREDKKLILDCSDLVIRGVKILDYSIVTHLKDATISELLDKPSEDLVYVVNDWCIEIDVRGKEEALDAGETLLVMIEYDTREESRSLHWRQDGQGDPCVYTAAASINNRGLFPCQVW